MERVLDWFTYYSQSRQEPLLSMETCYLHFLALATKLNVLKFTSFYNLQASNGMLIFF